MPSLCPYCQSSLESGLALIACPECGATHHPDCYRENGGCAVPGCAGRPGTAPTPPRATAPVSPRQDTPQRLVVDDRSLPLAAPVDNGQASSSLSRTRLTDTEKILIIATLVLAIVVIIILVLLLA